MGLQKGLQKKNVLHGRSFIMLCIMYEQLAFCDSTCRANTCTCTTLNARSRINLELAVSLRDCSYWALVDTCAASYTLVSNYVSHNFVVLIVCGFIFLCLSLCVGISGAKIGIFCVLYLFLGINLSLGCVYGVFIAIFCVFFVLYLML